MNNELGTVITAMVTDQNEKSYFVQKNGITYGLDKKEVESELSIGDMVKGFVYENMNKQLKITTQIPKVRIGHYGWGVVTDVRRDLGVFVDIGLEDKDIVVSLDNMPELKSLWPKKGDRLMISLRIDLKDRIWGELADEDIFRSISRIPSQQDDWKNQNTTATVYRLKMVGTFVLTDDFHIGFIHPTERDAEPRLGEQVEARVIGVSPHGMLNLSLKPRAHEALEDDAQMIMALLEKSPTSSLPYTDKSNPDDIRDYFGISKAQFKRALGRLMKNKLIVQEDGQTKLVK
ncbi:MAG TPA: DNA-binding protein [Candidatus Jeotgalibaca merdavium]|uniref:DNA-binding protein n=2 Tax=Jeotgalibaca TaxID=1470540 RepID=A0A6G7KC67_9LACT|nr:S1-like domain-containing RNA-binding protein [Jeotgalibaca arthritidis]QII82801.1 DNA-binding protein [Jeotgalibaca arthritidis]HJA90723.1 DNA-binding protein [Candidatus Jeotgalibaca merdavium]